MIGQRQVSPRVECKLLKTIIYFLCNGDAYPAVERFSEATAKPTPGIERRKTSPGTPAPAIRFRCDDRAPNVSSSAACARAYRAAAAAFLERAGQRHPRRWLSARARCAPGSQEQHPAVALSPDRSASDLWHWPDREAYGRLACSFCPLLCVRMPYILPRTGCPAGHSREMQLVPREGATRQSKSRLERTIAKKRAVVHHVSS